MTVLRCEFELLRRYEARTQVIGNALAFLSHFVSLKGGQAQRGIYEFTVNRLVVSFDLEKYKENLGKSLMVCDRTYLVHAFGKYMASSLRNMYIGMQKRIKTTKQEEQKENQKQKIMQSRNSLALTGCILELIRQLFKDEWYYLYEPLTEKLRNCLREKNADFNLEVEILAIQQVFSRTSNADIKEHLENGLCVRHNVENTDILKLIRPYQIL